MRVPFDVFQYLFPSPVLLSYLGFSWTAGGLSPFWVPILIPLMKGFFCLWSAATVRCRVGGYERH
jgi:hypothetical protein